MGKKECFTSNCQLDLKVKVIQKTPYLPPVFVREHRIGSQRLSPAVSRQHPCIADRIISLVEIVPHHVLVVPDKAGHVLPIYHVLEDLYPIWPAVDHVTQYIQVIPVTELYRFQHPAVQVVHAVYVAAYVNTHFCSFLIP